MVNHQIPMEKDLKFNGKPSDSYEGKWGNHAKTIRFLWEKIRKPIKDSKTDGKPSDSYGERLEN